MASYDVAYRWMMSFEDPEFLFKKVPDAPDIYTTDPSSPTGTRVRIGAYAISGINSHSYPAQFSHIESIPQAQRAAAVENFYELMFWNKWYDQIVSDEVAKRVFQFAVNRGPETAVEVLQQAVNALGGAQIDDDGDWGPITVAAVNNQNSAMLVNSLQAQMLGSYQSVVDKDPAKAKYLGTAQKPGPWWIRATK